MTSTRPATDHPAWDRALREHRDALEAVCTTIAQLKGDAWRRPLSHGTWSPAQIAEHLDLVYHALGRELAGQGSMQLRVAPWMQRVLRWLLLPHILFHGSFPLRARSPRELRPSADGVEQQTACQRLMESAERFERDLVASRGQGRSLTHPYFGRLSPLRTLRFCSVHMEHHRRQMQLALSALPDPLPPPRRVPDA